MIRKTQKILANLKQGTADFFGDLVFLASTLVGVAAMLLFFIIALYSCFSMLASIVHFQIQNAMVYFFLMAFFGGIVWGILGSKTESSITEIVFFPVAMLGWIFLGVAIPAEFILRKRVGTTLLEVIISFLKGEMAWQIV